MKKKILFIVAPVGYQDYEYEAPKKILETDGFEVVTASSENGLCRGYFGGEIKADFAISEVQADDFSAVVLIGGNGCLKAYSKNENIFQMLADFKRKNKIISAICIAPVVLAQAGNLKGKDATVWNEDGKQAREIEKYGANFIEKNVVRDGNIITANGPKAAEAFGKIISELIQKI